MGILLRVVQFAPLDGATYMSPRFYRGNCRVRTRVSGLVCHFERREKSIPLLFNMLPTIVI
ncbi:MAG: hypothetical protein ACP5VS_04310, partial [Desulfomonilaceae bacterium]